MYVEKKTNEHILYIHREYPWEHRQETANSDGLWEEGSQAGKRDKGSQNGVVCLFVCF